MKAIILAAGEGSRLKKYTTSLPKGMLSFDGESLIERQIRAFKRAGIEDIIIVRGFKKEKIDFPGVSYYDNDLYADTNMLYSLFVAEEVLFDDVIISYSDILFEDDLLKGMIESEYNITVAVDINWEKYWNMRYGRIDIDTESLKLGEKESIKALGLENPILDEIDARYVGLIKLSNNGAEIFKKIWHLNKDSFWEKSWQVSGKPLKKAYLTDMLQAVIDAGEMVNYFPTQNGWIEFDTNEDYEKAIMWLKNGNLSKILKLQ